MRLVIASVILCSLLLVGCNSKSDKFVKPSDVVNIQKNEFQSAGGGGGGLGNMKVAPTTPAAK